MASFQRQITEADVNQKALTQKISAQQQWVFLGRSGGEPHPDSEGPVKQLDFQPYGIPVLGVPKRILDPHSFVPGKGLDPGSGSVCAGFGCVELDFQESVFLAAGEGVEGAQSGTGVYPAGDAFHAQLRDGNDVSTPNFQKWRVGHGSKKGGIFGQGHSGLGTEVHRGMNALMPLKIAICSNHGRVVCGVSKGRDENVPPFLSSKGLQSRT